MRTEIIESIKRMSADDRLDVAVTFGIEGHKAKDIKQAAFANEDIAEYCLNY